MDRDVQTYGSFHSDGEGYSGRIDVVTGPTGRRRWPEHVKAAIVLETYRDGVSVADIARKHDVSPPQLHAWRRAARDGLLPMPDDEALEFLPVSVAGAPGAPDSDLFGTLTLEIGDVRVIVPQNFDANHLSRTIVAIRGSL
ncbi:IS66-like element accessory protein TnpA [Puniceibacterium sediminis]|uniref:Transposase n=1 Tax=Puniceibacterium sediminis TaxID=1608407 RepID=A0A238ZZK8_9RHOB|nr:transposase [Puniceibacterium sediminis]SNR88699.1 transposase [Puniceibacterium sediminis]